LSKQRIRKAERKTCGIVEAGDGTIVWIPGVRISQIVRVTPGTRKILMISFQSCPATE